MAENFPYKSNACRYKQWFATIKLKLMCNRFTLIWIFSLSLNSMRFSICLFTTYNNWLISCKGIEHIVHVHICKKQQQQKEKNFCPCEVLIVRTVLETLRRWNNVDFTAFLSVVFICSTVSISFCSIYWWDFPIVIWICDDFFVIVCCSLFILWKALKRSHTFMILSMILLYKITWI